MNVPLDPESVLARLEVKVRTPSSVEGAIEPPNQANLWVPKTQTPHKTLTLTLRQLHRQSILKEE